jgi:glycerophosphoryl diester phosphodiesterase
MMNRRNFLAATSAGLLSAAIDPQYRLIAHRGGIVDEQHSENSPGSLQTAIERGYWMIEVDIRRTRDGEPILQHDPDFRRYYNDPHKVEDLTWAEVGRLRAQPGGNVPIHFRDVCRMCEGKVRLMLDIKGNDWPEEFYITLRKLLEQHNLLRNAYALGGGGANGAKHLTPHCYRSVNRKSLREAIDRQEDVAARYFLFELASDLNEESFELCRKSKVTAVAAINTFRYTMARRDEQKGPEEDAARLKKLGVRHYQIDSRYDPIFMRS